MIVRTRFWPSRWCLGGGYLLVLGLVLSGTGCQTVIVKAAPPPCPDPSHEAVDNLENLQRSSLPHDDLELWIGEIERYCCAIDVLRGGPDCPDR